MIAVQVKARQTSYLDSGVGCLPATDTSTTVAVKHNRTDSTSALSGGLGKIPIHAYNESSKLDISDEPEKGPVEE